MFPILQIGPAAIQTPGLIILLSIWIGLSAAEKMAYRFNSDANDIYNIVFISLIAGIIGARITYVLQYIDIFVQEPINLLSLNLGLLDPIGGIAIGIIASIVYGNRKSLSLLPTLDALTPLFSIVMIGVSLSNFASGEGFGIETNLPWGTHLWGLIRHPTQIYEALAGLIILGIVWPNKREKNPNSEVAGETFLIFLALSSGFRLFLETFRGDSIILFSNFRSVQVITWILLAASIRGLRKLKTLISHP